MQGFSKLLFAGVLMCSSTLHAAPCAKAFCVTVEPTVCLMQQKGQKTCSLAFKIQWQSQLPLDVCVYAGPRQLQCWEQQREGTGQHELVLDAPLSLEFRDAHQQLLAQQPLTILSRQPERRRRLVAPWSVF